jgi:hypothetical protein
MRVFASPIFFTRHTQQLSNIQKPDERMKALYLMLAWVTASILYATGPRLALPGFSWSP